MSEYPRNTHSQDSDDFSRRLRQDAEAIEVDVSPAWKTRMQASLESSEFTGRAQAAPPPGSTAKLWLASSLSGLAVAAVIIVLVSRLGGETAPVPDTSQAVADSSKFGRTVPASVSSDWLAPELDVRTAEFTEPLRVELDRLGIDFERARESVESDLGSSNSDP